MKDKDSRPGKSGITRRGFIAAGAVFCGAAATPAWAKDPVIEFVKESCGSDDARPRILVGYASMCGSTGEIAAAVGKKLCAKKAHVDVLHLPEVESLEDYDAFVIGSPIHAGLWMREASRFLRRNKDALEKAPVAYFITCMALSSDNEDGKKLVQRYVELPLRVVPKIEPVAMGTFAGKVDYDKMPRRYHYVMRNIVPEDLDARNWDAIGQWGEDLAGQLIKG